MLLHVPLKSVDACVLYVHATEAIDFLSLFHIMLTSASKLSPRILASKDLHHNLAWLVEPIVVGFPVCIYGSQIVSQQDLRDELVHFAEGNLIEQLGHYSSYTTETERKVCVDSGLYKLTFLPIHVLAPPPNCTSMLLVVILAATGSQ